MCFVIKKSENFSDFFILGCGQSLRYEIIIMQTKDKNTSKHELFHVSSTSVDEDKNVFSGFSQSIGCLYFIGNGIDEGYTELLTRRYFGEEEDNFYFFEVLVMSLIEEIIGREKMEQLYFQSNLYGLILELRKYSSEREVLKFIQNVDFYNYINTSNFYLSFNRDLVISCLNDIACYLVKLFYTKQLLEVDHVDINLVKKFSEKLKEEIYFGKKKEKNKVYYFDYLDEKRVISEVNRDYVLKRKISR